MVEHCLRMTGVRSSILLRSTKKGKMEKVKFKDKVIRCQQCGQNFAWTADEQQFYFQRGLEEPTYCRVCRAAFKTAKKDKFRGKIDQ